MSQIKPCSPSLLPLRQLDWNEIVSYLGDARANIARLDEELRQGTRYIDLFLWNEAVSSLQSQKIEITLKEILLYRLAGIAEEKKEPYFQKILFTKQALDGAVASGMKQRFGVRFFCRIHAQIKQDSPRPEDIGRFRKRQNWIGAHGCKIEEAYFFPPLAAKVRTLFRNLESYLESKETDPLVQIAIAFAQFLIIHPFMDGNGRAARVFLPVYAMKKQLFSYPALLLSGYFETHREDYFQKLYQLTQSDAWEEWVVFFLKGVILQTTRMRHQIASLNKLFETVERLAGKTWAETLFRTPVMKGKRNQVIDLLLREKILIAHARETYFFAPLFRAMR